MFIFIYSIVFAQTKTSTWWLSRFQQNGLVQTIGEERGMQTSSPQQEHKASLRQQMNPYSKSWLKILIFCWSYSKQITTIVCVSKNLLTGILLNPSAENRCQVTKNMMQNFVVLDLGNSEIKS